MKEMSKSLILDMNMRNSVMLEKKILCNMNSRFIVNIKCAFQDFSNLYLILELMKGGSLRYHMNHFDGHFPEKIIKFIIINITFCLATIHFNDIIHQDIRPENFLFDDEGYLHLTNFNYALFREQENKKIDLMNKFESNLQIYLKQKNLVGKIEYIAPEYITNSEKHINFPLNFYSFGVICYELIFLKKPFKGNTRELLQKEMMEEKIDFNSDFKYSESLIDLVKKLLEIYPNVRLGTYNGIKEIKNCEYLYEFNWKGFFEKKYESPFVKIINKYKEKINYEKKDSMELFDFENINKNPIYQLDENKKKSLKLIELNPRFIDFFKDYDYIYFERGDIEEHDSLKVKKNKKENIITNKIRRISHSSCSFSSCSCSCSICNSDNNSEKASDVDDYYYYFKDKKKKHNKIRKVYLPIIEKKEKVIIPEIYPNIVLDAYKYQINKYRYLLKKLENKEEIKSMKEKDKYRKINSGRNNLYQYPKPLILNNLYYDPYRLYLKPSNSMPDLANYNKNNNYFKKTNFYPYFNNFNKIFFPDFKNEYSSASSTGIYDKHITKRKKDKSIKERKEEKEEKEDTHKIKKERKGKEKSGNKNKINKNKKTKKIKQTKKIKKIEKKKEESESEDDKSDINKKSSFEKESDEEEEEEESEENSSSEKTTKQKKLSTIKESEDEYKASSSNYK